MKENTGKLAAYCSLGGFCADFSTKSDGNMVRSNAKRIEVEKNRRSFIRRIGLERKDILRVRPSNGPNIELVSTGRNTLTRKVYLKKPTIQTDFDFYESAADGVLTFEPEVPVGLVSADCIPLVVVHDGTGLHGVVHVGLLGVLNNITSGLKCIFEEYRIDRREVQAYLGPSISYPNYDVTKSGLWNAIEKQAQEHPESSSYVSEYFDGTNFDIRGALIQQLREIGILGGNIGLFEKCTADADSNYFSHYSAIQSGGSVSGFYSIVWKR